MPGASDRLRLRPSDLFLGGIDSGAAGSKAASLLRPDTTGTGEGVAFFTTRRRAGGDRNGNHPRPGLLHDWLRPGASPALCWSHARWLATRKRGKNTSD